MDIELQENIQKALPLETSLISIASSSIDINTFPYQEYENSSKELPLLNFLPTSFYKYRHKLFHCFSKRFFIRNFSFGEIFALFLFSMLFILSEYWIFIKDFPIKKTKKFTGSLAAISIGFSLSFSVQNSLWTILLGIPFERGVFWHKFFAFWGICLGLYHSFVEEARYNEIRDISGLILLCLLIIIPIFSFFLIRRKFFTFFFIIHWFFFIGVFISAIIHKAGEVLIGAFLVFFDLILRYFVIKRNIKQVSVMKLPAEIIRVAFPRKNMQFKPGQYVFLCFPKLSFWEFHPFSISSSSSEEQVLIHIRVSGDWTRNLWDYLKKNTEEMECFINGPYGNPMINIDNEEIKVFLMVSGGIGVTPLQSICNELLNQRLRGRKLKKILFVWTVKDKFLVKSMCIDSLPMNLPLNFQPDLLEKENEIVDFRLFLTQVRNENEFYKGNIHLSKQKNVKLGRVNIEAILKEIVEFAKKENEEKVGVLCCGPEGLVRDVRELMGKIEGNGVRMEFHEEVFEF